VAPATALVLFCIIEEINAQVCARDTAGRGLTVDVSGFGQMLDRVGEEMHQVAFTARSAWPGAEITGQAIVERRNLNFAANGASA
jgi:hypothetical protein